MVNTEDYAFVRQKMRKKVKITSMAPNGVFGKWEIGVKFWKKWEN